MAGNLNEWERGLLRDVLAGPGSRAYQRDAFNKKTGRNMDGEHFRRAIKRLNKVEEEIPVDWNDDLEWANAGNPAFAGEGMSGVQGGRIRLILPDIHGNLQNRKAVDAVLNDVSLLMPDEIIQMGDLCDVNGIWATHQRSYISELEYTYESDIADAQRVIDELQRRAPNARITVLQGNHDARIAKTLSRLMLNAKDASMADRLMAPEALMKFKQRGIEYIKMDEFYDGLSTRGVIKRGHVHFVHGISVAKNAAAVHLSRFGANVNFGHVHRAMSCISRTIAAEEIGAWSAGCLCELAPLYLHTAPSEWSNGYSVELYEKSGQFLHIQIPIVGGKSMLSPLLERLRPSRAMGH